MFGYMTDLSTIDIARTEEITAEGNKNDLVWLLFSPDNSMV